MAVPNTNTFSMQDVANEINPPASPVTLIALRAYTEYYKLDPTYYSGGQVTSLLQYRNYGGSTTAVKEPYTVGYDFDSGSNGSFNACSATPNTTVYQDSWSFNVVDPIYILDQSGLNFINAPAGTYAGGDSDGFGISYVRYWNGFSWTGSVGSCIF